MHGGWKSHVSSVSLCALFFQILVAVSRCLCRFPFHDVGASRGAAGLDGSAGLCPTARLSRPSAGCARGGDLRYPAQPWGARDADCRTFAVRGGAAHAADLASVLSPSVTPSCMRVFRFGERGWGEPWRDGDGDGDGDGNALRRGLPRGGGVSTVGVTAPFRWCR